MTGKEVNTRAPRSSDPFFEVYPEMTALPTAWRWRLKATNGRIIADSAEAYSTKGKAREAAERIISAIRYPETLPEIRTLKG